MHCAEIELLMAEALKARLAGEEEHRFQEHLAACPACHDQFESLRHLAAKLDSAYPRQAGRQQRVWDEIAATLDLQTSLNPYAAQATGPATRESAPADGRRQASPPLSPLPPLPPLDAPAPRIRPSILLPLWTASVLAASVALLLLGLNLSSGPSETPIARRSGTAQGANPRGERSALDRTAAVPFPGKKQKLQRELEPQEQKQARLALLSQAPSGSGTPAAQAGTSPAPDAPRVDLDHTRAQDALTASDKAFSQDLLLPLPHLPPQAGAAEEATGEKIPQPPLETTQAPTRIRQERTAPALGVDPAPGQATRQGPEDTLHPTIAGGQASPTAPAAPAAPVAPAASEKAGRPVRFAFDDTLGLALARATGPVAIFDPQYAAWRTLLPGECVPYGALVRTAHGAKAELAFGESRLRMDGQTELTVVREPAGTRVAQLSRGRMRIDLLRSNAGFEVRSGGGSVALTGTVVDLEAPAPNLAAARIVEGSVKVLAGGAARGPQAQEPLQVLAGQDVLLAAPLAKGVLEALSAPQAERFRALQAARVAQSAGNGAVLDSTWVAELDQPRKPRQASVGQLLVQDAQGRPGEPLRLAELAIRGHIRGPAALTQFDHLFQNASGATLEGTFYFPLPPGACLSRFAMYVDGEQKTLVEGEVVERTAARRVYESILRQRRDPALLEWMEGNLFKARIFPIPAHGEKRLILEYTELLPARCGLRRYALPLVNELTRRDGIGRLGIEIALEASSGATYRQILAPGYRQETRIEGLGTGKATARLALESLRPEADFVLLCSEGPSATAQTAAGTGPLAQGVWESSLFQSAGEDPYLLGGYQPRPRVTPGAAASAGQARPARDVLVVLEYSGNRTPADLAAQRKAMEALLSGLRGVSDRVALASADLGLVVQTKGFLPGYASDLDAAKRRLAGRSALGALDIGQVLVQAAEFLKQQTEPGHEQFLVYLGGGVASWGELETAQILSQAEALRRQAVRVVTAGVGQVVDAKLLGALAQGSSGCHLPLPLGDELEDAAFRLGLALDAAGTGGWIEAPRFSIQGQGVQAWGQYPREFGALLPGEEVFVLTRLARSNAQEGQDAAVRLVVEGRQGGEAYRDERLVSWAPAAGSNPVVARSWAQQHLEFLTAQPASSEAQKEIVALAQTWTLMSPYTSFLVLESNDDYRRYDIDRRKRRPVWGSRPEMFRLAEQPRTRRSAVGQVADMPESTPAPAPLAPAAVEQKPEPWRPEALDASWIRKLQDTEEAHKASAAGQQEKRPASPNRTPLAQGPAKSLIAQGNERYEAAMKDFVALRGAANREELFRRGALQFREAFDLYERALEVDPNNQALEARFQQMAMQRYNTMKRVTIGDAVLGPDLNSIQMERFARDREMGLKERVQGESEVEVGEAGRADRGKIYSPAQRAMDYPGTDASEATRSPLPSGTTNNSSSSAATAASSSSPPADTGTVEYKRMKAEVDALRTALAQRQKSLETAEAVDATLENKYGPNAKVTTRDGKLTIGALVSTWYAPELEGTGGPGGTELEQAARSGAGAGDHDGYYRIRRSPLKFSLDLDENLDGERSSKEDPNSRIDSKPLPSETREPQSSGFQYYIRGYNGRVGDLKDYRIVGSAEDENSGPSGQGQDAAKAGKGKLRTEKAGAEPSTESLVNQITWQDFGGRPGYKTPQEDSDRTRGEHGRRATQENQGRPPLDVPNPDHEQGKQDQNRMERALSEKDELRHRLSKELEQAQKLGQATEEKLASNKELNRQLEKQNQEKFKEQSKETLVPDGKSPQRDQGLKAGWPAAPSGTAEKAVPVPPAGSPDLAELVRAMLRLSERIAKEHPAEPQPYAELAALEARIGLLKEAREQTQEALRRLPKAPQCGQAREILFKNLVLLSAGAACYEALQQAIEAFEGEGAAAERFARSLLERIQTERSPAVLKQAAGMVKDPGLRGVVFSRLANLEPVASQRLEYLELAYLESEKEERYLEPFLRELLASGAAERAQRKIEEHLSAGGYRPWMGELLAEVYRRQGRTADLLRALTQEVAQRPREAGPRSRLAGVLMGLGRTQEALREGRLACQFRPEDGELLLGYSRLAERARALEDWERAALGILEGAWGANGEALEREGEASLKRLKEELKKGKDEARLKALDLRAREARSKDLEIVLTWDTEGTDVDLNVTEPGAHVVNYQERSSFRGSFLDHDDTDGQGPETFTVKRAAKGEYLVKVNYFAGGVPTTAKVVVYRRRGSAQERSQSFTIRLGKEKEWQEVTRISEP